MTERERAFAAAIAALDSMREGYEEIAARLKDASWSNGDDWRPWRIGANVLDRAIARIKEVAGRE